MNVGIENMNTELFRIMSNIARVKNDTKGAIYVALESVWFDLDRIMLKDMLHTSKLLDKGWEARKQLDKLTADIKGLCAQENCDGDPWDTFQQLALDARAEMDK